jgi:hypothetical protein
VFPFCHGGRSSCYSEEWFPYVVISLAAVAAVVALIAIVFWIKACGQIRERYALRRRFVATARVNDQRLDTQEATVLEGPTPGNLFLPSCQVCGFDVAPDRLTCAKCHNVCVDRLRFNAFAFVVPTVQSTVTLPPVAKDKSVVKEDADDADADADAVHGIRAALAGDAAAAAADDDDDDLDDGPGKACSVCLEKFVAGDSVIALPSCIHIFHADCICAWLKTQFVCAECSVPIVKAGSQS